MRKVIAYELLSLDGVAEQPERFFGDWATWDDALEDNLASVIATQDTVLLGRRSYDEWADYWPGSDIEPFASFINGVEKHVATSRPLDRPWTDARAVDGDVAAFVRKLRGQSGGDIGIHASISLIQGLLTAGVVDELQLVVAPTVAAGGRRLLDGVPEQQLTLLSSATSPTGSLMLHYRVGAAA